MGLRLLVAVAQPGGQFQRLPVQPQGLLGQSRQPAGLGAGTEDADLPVLLEQKPVMKKTRQTAARRSTATAPTPEGFTQEERGAMKERARELKASARRGSRAAKAAEEAAAVVAKIADMSEGDRVLAERLHAIVTDAAPDLAPKLWYGMPLYAKDGRVVCFFQSAQKFGTRYATLGFSDKAELDDGSMWATSYALTEPAIADEARIAALVRQAAG